MDISGISHTLTQIIYDYNENISYYNRNMRDLIHVYERTVNNTLSRSNDTGNIYISRSNSSIPSRPDISNNHIRNIINPPIWNLFNSYSLNNPIGTMRFQNTFEDVVIRPTMEQINRATEIIQWDTSFSQISCPISLERFEPLQNICRIRYCGHMYNNESLLHWFETNVRCPVCRYDIRDYIIHNSGTSLQSDSLLQGQVTIPPVVSYPDSNDDSSEAASENNYDRIPDIINDDDAHDIIYESTTYIRNFGGNNQIIQPSESNTDTSYIRNNLANIFRNILTNEIATQIPLVNNSVNDLFYELNIPVEFDISYSNLSTNPYN